MKSINLFLLFLIISACTAKHPTPVNPAASVEAVELLNFLYAIKGHFTLSGEHNFIQSGSRYNELVHTITGKYPVIWGSDFSFCAIGDNAKDFQHCGPMNLSTPFDSFSFNTIPVDTLRSRMVEEAIRQYHNGHIITLMWHNCYPTFGDSCNGNSIWAMENRPDAQQWDSLTTEGTALNKAWKKQMEGIVKYLQILRDAHVPILWRPYHEMNGVWFWWCNQKGDNGFKKLWVMMYKYFTIEKKINNLLWVWDANAPRDIKGDEAYAYELFYPGNEFVDVLAADIYHNDYRQSHQDQLMLLGEGKPITMGEVGQMPTDSILDKQNDWSWFMVWGYYINIQGNTNEGAIKLFNSPRVLTLDKIERDEKGRIRVK